MVTEQEIEDAMDETAANPNGKTSKVLQTAEHDGQRATVTIERWLEIDEDKGFGVIATPMVSIDIAYAGFENVTSFPFFGPAAQSNEVALWAIGDMAFGGYHEEILTDRREMVEISLTEADFLIAIRAVMVEASDAISVEFDV